MSKFLYCDGGRATSKRPKQKNDCTVRALALVSGMTYDVAYDLLAAAGRKCGGRFNFRRWAESAALPGGRRLTWSAFPAVKGSPRMNPYRFAEENPYGRFVLRTAKHVIAVDHGIILDTEAPPPGRCVYGCWRLV